MARNAFAIDTVRDSSSYSGFSRTIFLSSPATSRRPTASHLSSRNSLISGGWRSRPAAHRLLHSRLSPHSLVRLPSHSLPSPTTRRLPSLLSSLSPLSHPTKMKRLRLPSHSLPSPIARRLTSLLTRLPPCSPIFLRSPSHLPLPSFQPFGWPARPCSASRSCSGSACGTPIAAQASVSSCN